MTHTEPLSLAEARQYAARISAGVDQLEARGTAGKALIDPMFIYLPDLQRIWEGADDAVLDTLCDEYPAFFRYATVMEEAAEAERRRAAAGQSAFAGLPPLPEPLRTTFARVYTEAAIFEHQVTTWLAEHEAGQTMAPERETSLENAYERWGASVEQLTTELRPAPLDRQSLEVILEAMNRLRTRVAGLAADLRRSIPAL